MNRTLLIIILATGLCWECEQDIQIDTPGGFEGVVFIEGLLVPGKPPRVYVSQSVPFFDAKITPQQVFARGARVRITSQEETQALVADSIFDKFRCRWVPFYQGATAAKIGETYALEVVFKGRTYAATTTINQAPPVIEEITYTPEFIDLYGGHDGVEIRLKDAVGPGNFYRFQMNRPIDRSVAHAHVLEVVPNDCTNGEAFWITDLGRTIFSDVGNDGAILELLAEVSLEYSKGDSTWVTIQSLDARSAAFYQELDDQLITILNPFVEPVFLKSQLAGGAIGVFGSIVPSDSVLFVYPQDNPP